MTTTTQYIIRTDVTPENYEDVTITFPEGDAGIIRLYECMMGDTRFWQIVIDVDLYEIHEALCATQDEALSIVRTMAMDRGDGQECECGLVSAHVIPTHDVNGSAVPDSCMWCHTRTLDYLRG